MISQPNSSSTLAIKQQAHLTHQQFLQQNPNQHQQLQQHQPSSEFIGYYFGSISRETAEWILRNHGNNKDGTYLLRSSGPNDDFVLSLMVLSPPPHHQSTVANSLVTNNNVEVLHYKIIETDDSFVALHGQVGDEKFSTIDELIDKAQGVATKPRWPVLRVNLEHQILPPTYWGLTVDQVRLAILLKAKQWGFPLLSSLFQQQQQHSPDQIDENNPLLAYARQQPTSASTDGKNLIYNNATTLNNETIRTLIYKSLHEFQPWFHGKISREEAERRIEEGASKDGRFLVRERDNYSYAMCISHKKTPKHYRIDVLPTGELAIQDGRKFTSLMALVSHYTIMSDGLWCALTEACVRPIQTGPVMGHGSNSNVNTPVDPNFNSAVHQAILNLNSNVRVPCPQNIYCIAPDSRLNPLSTNGLGSIPIRERSDTSKRDESGLTATITPTHNGSSNKANNSLCSAHHGLGVASIKMPIREWLHSINNKWTQFVNLKGPNQSLNSFLFGNQNPLNNHCRHRNHRSHHHLSQSQRKCNHDVCCGQNTNCSGNLRCSHPNSMMQHLSSIDQRRPKLKSKNVKPIMSKHHDLAASSAPWSQNNCLPSTGPLRPLAQTDQILHSKLENFAIEREGTSSFNPNDLITQNSNFSLNQSFIGSPLFAVNQAVYPDQRTMNQSGSNSCCSSTNSSNQHVEEEKLISPAQSISANLDADVSGIPNNNNNNNNPYNLNNDFYGSQTSTAIINDQLGQSSTSSSSGPRAINNNAQNILPASQKSGPFPLKLIQRSTTRATTINSDLTSATRLGAPARGAQKIMCGQHAGSAYRYTNCYNDENSLKFCSHKHPSAALVNYRAADDSQLPARSSNLMGPAALTKFIQFQDGQCLRTHRDARSIQMAYLSALQSLNGTESKHVGQNLTNNRIPINLNQPDLRQPFDSFNNTLNMSQGSDLQMNYKQRTNIDTVSHSMINDLMGVKQANMKFETNGNSRSNINSIRKQGNSWNETLLNNSMSQCNDVDLIDCNVEGFEFKYDPKLIKSSSIETLCSIGDNDVTENLSKFKNNTELMMSLPTYWFSNDNNTNRHQDILDPISVNQVSNSDDNCNNQSQDFAALYQNSYESFMQHQNMINNSTQAASSAVRSQQQNPNNEGVYLDHMKKKHDLDELTTSLLAELTASLRAQVDLKNKRAGFGVERASNTEEGNNFETYQTSGLDKLEERMIATNPMELVSEFDTLARSN